MTDDSVRGRFIWHELRTPNPAGASDFYSTALGWKAEGTEDRSRSTFLASSGPLGGCAEQSPTAAPRWIPFLTVANADNAFRDAVELGADAVVEPTAIEDGGRYAVLTDPQGATIGVYSADDFGEDRDPSPGEFSWHELATTDARAALDFYAALFGWELVREHDMGPMGAYLIVGFDGKQLGGIFNKDSAGMSGEPAWLSYVRVSDLSGTIEKVKAARGSVLTGPMEVPGGDWIAQLLDPHGAAFALHAIAADAKAEASQARRAQEDASKAKPAQQDASKAERPQEEASKAKPARKEAVKAPPAKKEGTARVDARPAAGAITEIWSATETGAGEAETTSAPAKKTAKKKPSAAEAAKSKATKKKASTTRKAGVKKAAGASKKAAKKPGAKKSAAKKSGAKKSGKKKASTKKATKKTAKKRTAKKAATKKAAAKKAGKTKAASQKKSGKKAAGKKAGNTAGSSSRKKSGKTGGQGSRKKSGKTASSGSRKKSGKTSAGRAGAKKAGKKKTGKKVRKKSGRR